jgi:hypothetical protein
MTAKCTKLPYDIPNGCQIFQLAIDYAITFSITRLSKIYPSLDFLSENIPSGNPAAQLSRLDRRKSGSFKYFMGGSAYITGSALCLTDRNRID